VTLPHSGTQSVADVVPKAAKIDRHTLCIARGAVIPQHTLLGACLATRAGDERASAPLVRRFFAYVLRGIRCRAPEEEVSFFIVTRYGRASGERGVYVGTSAAALLLQLSECDSSLERRRRKPCDAFPVSGYVTVPETANTVSELFSSTGHGSVRVCSAAPISPDLQVAPIFHKKRSLLLRTNGSYRARTSTSIT